MQSFIRLLSAYKINKQQSDLKSCGQNQRIKTDLKEKIFEIMFAIIPKKV